MWALACSNAAGGAPRGGTLGVLQHPHYPPWSWRLPSRLLGIRIGMTLHWTRSVPRSGRAAGRPRTAWNGTWGHSAVDAVFLGVCALVAGNFVTAYP